ncbi:DUF600 domain-containing protein [Pseudomonas sp. BN417]|uniref:hypothetical protein n=1 Tax=Pseudomonas sp. BN417 TaxID=2567890 RepID=UPI002458A5BF|nr:hypothetical protein [Pseudomonas sp. BN417]MDH4557420.1 DUF600 domain-containing protein [Pseudomonas sp. BN417]
MAKEFEDYFSEYQTDMVSIALEYADGRADEIFIYGACEDGTTAFDVFYRINGKIVEKDNLNSAVVSGISAYDTSGERQSAMLNIGLDNLDNIEAKCGEFHREMPTEIRLHYDVKNNKMRAKYRYDRIFSEHADILPDDVFDTWLQSVSNGEPPLG